MQTIRVSDDSFSYALEARVQLALYRIAVIAGAQDDADQHLYDAEKYARKSGRRACWEGSEDVPMLLVDEPSLLREWDEGYDAEACGWLVWFGEWLSDLDGRIETRPSVALSPDGFVPVLVVAHRGGGCAPNIGQPRATLQEAIWAAKEMETRWHFEGDAN